VRIATTTAPAGAELEDNTSAPFSVRPTIDEVTYPEFQKVWYYNETGTIQWEATSAPKTDTNTPQVKIEYIKGASAPVEIIGSIDSTNGTNIYPWNPVDDVKHESVTVKITYLDYTGPVVEKDSAVFSIRPRITVTDIKTSGYYDNGLQAGTLYTNIIQWSYTGTKLSKVKIYYDDDGPGGADFTGVIDVTGNVDISAGNPGIDWTVPAGITFRDDIQIRVRDTDTTNFPDVKGETVNFKTRGGLELTAPIGGITWLAGSTVQSITWDYYGDNMSTIDIYYDDDSTDGRTWDATTKIFSGVDPGADGSGSKLWAGGSGDAASVPKLATNTGAILIESTGDRTVEDIGDVKVGIIFGTISPNGNETLYSEISSDITWEASGVTGVLGNPDV
ncbi:MAG: hypothetical protein KAS66_14535, partial [Candidatus Omnitrophica bacterium]|nr:hypothetical protein [Candidatus Omnitrophota bacterium]